MKLQKNLLFTMPFQLKFKFTLTMIASVIIISVGIVTEQWIWLALLLSPVLIYLSIEKPFIFPLGLYAFLLPIDDILRISGSGSTFTKLLGILSIAVLVIKGGLENKIKRPAMPAIWLGLFIIYGVLSVLWAIDAQRVMSILPTVISLFVLYIVCASYKTRREDFITLGWCIVTGGVFAAILIIVKYLQGYEYSAAHRLALVFGETQTAANVLAFSFLIPISLCLQKIIESRGNLMRGLLIFNLVIMTLSVFITGSRGGFMGILVIVTIYLLKMKKRIPLIIILVVAIVFIAIFTPGFFVDRLFEATDSGGAGRVTIWQIGWNALSGYWAFGAGLGNFSVAFNEFSYINLSYEKSDRGAHNIYLQCIVEFGVVGFLLLISAIKSHYNAAKPRMGIFKMDSTMLIAALLGMLVSSFFLGTLWKKPFWLMWMFIIIYQNSVKENDEKISMHQVL